MLAGYARRGGSAAGSYTVGNATVRASRLGGQPAVLFAFLARPID